MTTGLEMEVHPALVTWTVYVPGDVTEILEDVAVVDQVFPLV